MNKISYFTLFILLIIISIITLSNPSLIINSVISSSKLFVTTLFPSLFLFYLLTDTLINYNVIYYISSWISRISKKDINLIMIFILSMLCGYPSNAKYINEMINNGYIDKESGYRLIGKTFFPSPMFVLGTIGTLYLNNYKLGFLILVSIYITNIILIFKFKFSKSILPKKEKFVPFGVMLSSSIKNTFSTLMIIMGSVVMFSTLINIINYYLDLKAINITLLNIVLEMSSASKKISTLFISTNLKVVLLTLTLTFGGLCIHSQMLSIISDKDLNYKYILFDRVKAILLNIVIINILLALS